MSANLNAQVVRNVIDRVISGRVQGVAHQLVPHTRSLFTGEPRGSQRRSASARSLRSELGLGCGPTCALAGQAAAALADGDGAVTPATYGGSQPGKPECGRGDRGDTKRRDMRCTATHAWRVHRAAACRAVFACGTAHR